MSPWTFVRSPRNLVTRGRPVYVKMAQTRRRPFRTETDSSDSTAGPTHPRHRFALRVENARRPIAVAVDGPRSRRSERREIISRKTIKGKIIKKNRTCTYAAASASITTRIFRRKSDTPNAHARATDRVSVFHAPQDRRTCATGREGPSAAAACVMSTRASAQSLYRRPPSPLVLPPPPPPPERVAFPCTPSAHRRCRRRRRSSHTTISAVRRVPGILWRAP